MAFKGGEAGQSFRGHYGSVGSFACLRSLHTFFSTTPRIAQGTLSELKWNDIHNIVGIPGCLLGTNRVLPGAKGASHESLVASLKAHNIKVSPVPG